MYIKATIKTTNPNSKTKSIMQGASEVKNMKKKQGFHIEVEGNKHIAIKKRESMSKAEKVNKDYMVLLL